MKAAKILAIGLTVKGMIGFALGGPSAPTLVSSREIPVSSTALAGPTEMEKKADKRYNEMLGKMQAAIEEIAQLYGNPDFLQVFTNDIERASELKTRLKAARNAKDINQELEGLEKKRDDLLTDIALKTRETSRLEDKIIRQRRALDALADAIDQAKNAVEDTIK